MKQLSYEYSIGYFRVNKTDPAEPRLEYSFEGDADEQWLDAYKQPPDEESFGTDISAQLLFIAWCALRAYFWSVRNE